MRFKVILQTSTMIVLSALVVGLFSFRGTSAAVPGVNQRLDTSTANGNPNSTTSSNESINQDGRYVVFTSMATNLVSGYTLSGTYKHVFVRDRKTNTTSLVSVSNTGVPANAYSQEPRISGNGRFVVFYSPATNLTSTSVSGMYVHVYIRDLQANTTRIVDVTSSGVVNDTASSSSAAVSADGNYIAFASGANTLVSPSLAAFGNYIFLKNMSTGAVAVVNRGVSGASANGNSHSPYISCEGRYVAFNSTAANLDTTNTQSSGYQNVYLFDVLNGSSIKNLTPSANGSSTAHSVSCDGTHVTVRSSATNLQGANVASSYQQTYVYDILNDNFELVSQSSSGTVGDNNSNDWSSVSDGGRYVVFASVATNLVSGDTNAKYDVFLRDRIEGTTEVISKSSSGAIGNGASLFATMSANGQYVSYYSDSTNLVSGVTGRIFASQTGAVNMY